MGLIGRGENANIGENKGKTLHQKRTYPHFVWFPLLLNLNLLRTLSTSLYQQQQQQKLMGQIEREILLSPSLRLYGVPEMKEKHQQQQ